MSENKYPMPALTEQERGELIAFNLRRLAIFESCDDLRPANIKAVRTIQITLAALTAEPVGDVVAWNHPSEERTCSVNLREFHLQPGQLYTAPPVPVLEGNSSAVPNGWKLVPVEPTPEMLSAAKEWFGLTTTAEGLYQIMTDSAPLPPAPGGDS